MTVQPEVTALPRLAEKFPGWTIWRSDKGHWWATRHALVTEAEGEAGCGRMVDAAKSTGLSQKLVAQEAFAQQAADAVESRLGVLEFTYPGWVLTYLLPQGRWQACLRAPATAAQTAAGVLAEFSSTFYQEFREQLAEQATLIDRCGGPP